MKKKGLIISTVVMVVVLIAALTTSTYAWFTTTTKTTISGFDVSVVANNAINIGVKTNNTHEATVTNYDFMSGTVTWVGGTAGALGKDAGGWKDGTTGLTPELTHGIKWGAQSKAVGAMNGSSNTLSTTIADYGYIGSGSFNGTTATGKANENGTNTYLNATNLKGTALDTPTAAYANQTPSITDSDPTEGDYAYLFLGASPTKELKSSSLYIVLDGTTSPGTTVGVLAAVHVAYRITKSGENVATEWKEAEFFENVSYDKTLASQSPNWEDKEKEAYKAAFDKDAPTTKASVIKIKDLSTTQGAIDQIEIIIYLAGSDADCVDSGKNAGGAISMFFYTEDVDSIE